MNPDIHLLPPADPLPLFDGHLDLADAAIAYGRDLTWTLDHIRQIETALPETEKDRGTATVCLPELRRAGVAFAVATLFSRARADMPITKRLRRSDSDQATPGIAHAMAHAQLAYYRLLESQGRMQIVETAAQLNDAVKAVRGAGGGAELERSGRPEPTGLPLYAVILIECADSITEPAQVEHWWAAGVRAVGLAHYGRNVYAVGNGEDGPITPAGVELLGHVNRLGMTLDLSHLSDTSFRQALEVFPGRVCATHSNCRALAPNDRQFTDAQLRAIIARDGVIGAVCYNKMLVPCAVDQKIDRQSVSLSHVTDHIDHVCQLAGDTRHAAIGSDLDGGFGRESCPREIDTIADLQRLAPILLQRGCQEADLAAIFHGNWLRFWSEALPQVNQPREHR